MSVLIVTLAWLPYVAWASNTADGRATVILATARHDDPYYNKKLPGRNTTKYDDIIDFHTVFTNKIMAAGDNVVIACDEVTCDKLYENGLPSDILWVAGFKGIWMRDLSRVSLPKQVGFLYINDYMKERDSLPFQRAFDAGMAGTGVKFSRRHDIALDGGNVVDNFVDLAVISARVYKDNYAWNDRQKKQLKQQLEGILNYDIAIVPELEDDTTGHSDGVVSFIDDYTLAFSEIGNDFDTTDGRPAQNATVHDLKAQFGDWVKYVGIPYFYPGSSFKGFTSSCGTHINALLTEKNLYVPVFAQDPENVKTGITKELEEKAMAKFESKENTKKNVVRVPVPKKICEMGGSVRCLSYPLKGRNADILVEYVKAQSEEKRRK